jgi:hypothetical protein
MALGLFGNRRSVVIGCALGALALVVLTVVLAWASGARITGGTPEERVACIGRMVADRPSGASKVLAEAAVSEPAAVVRAAAVIGLAQLGEKQYRPVIEKACADPEAKVREAAAGALSQYGDAPAVELLGRLADKDADDHVRAAAMGAVGRCGDPHAIVVLLQMAESADKPTTQLWAMQALMGKFGGKLPPERAPANVRLWRDQIQYLKRMPAIQQAYASAGAELIQRPEDVWTRKDPHDAGDPGPPPK